MNLYEMIIINTIFIIFPLLFCLLYQSYNKTFDREKGNLCLDCALFSSFYLIIRFGTNIYSGNPILLFNIPLLLAYIKNRKFNIILLSIAAIIYYYNYLKFSLIFLIIEYIGYYLIYLFGKKANLKKDIVINIFIAVKIIILTLSFYFTYKGMTMNNYIELFIISFFFYAITKFTIYLFERAEEVLSLHKKVQDFENDKNIHESLFKITHEIKNPVAVCKGYLDMYDVNNVEHSKKYIPIIREEIERILILLQDFLSINKIKIEKDIMDVNLMLQSVLNNFMPIIEDKKIKFDFQITDEEIFIYGDYNRLSQVIINMIKNSIEAMSDFRVGKIKVYTKENKNNIKIYVEDNGVGMNKEELLKIKQPFFTTKPRGTGLGVFLSSEIIKEHNGSVKYNSSPNEGTTVIITIPKNMENKGLI